MELDEEAVNILSCDLTVRPSNAAGISELLPFVVRVERNCDRVIVEFNETAKECVDSFVAAERLCCTGLSWTVEDEEAGLRLVIDGTAEQLTVVEQWFV